MTEIAVGNSMERNPSPRCTSNCLFLYRGIFLFESFRKLLLWVDKRFFWDFVRGMFPRNTLIAHSHNVLITLLEHFLRISFGFLLLEINFRSVNVWSVHTDILSQNE